MAIAAVGHFDHYLCRQDDNLRGRDHLEIPQMMRQVLLDNGVPEDNVTIVTDEREANSLALSMARAGDLVLMLCDAVARSWKQIIYFQPSDTVLTERNLTANKIDLGSVGFDELSLDTEVELIRDERGVRLARPA
jgi:cyanophycin synthetase